MGVSRVDPALPLPVYATPGSAGMDLLCRVETRIEPASIGLVPANLIVAIPAGYMLLISLRSGTPRRTGLTSPHGVGIIDQDYRGPLDELKIQVFNPTDEPVTVRRGDRIAQAVLLPIERIEWNEEAPRSDVSRGGFGSTG